MSDPPSPAPEGDAREFDRIDVSEFVDGTGAAAADHTAAEGQPPATQADIGREGRLGTLRQMALKTKPSTPLDEIESPWAPERGGVARIYRGIQKATGHDGLPAVADVCIGFMEWMYTFQLEEPKRSESETTNETAGDPDDEAFVARKE